MFFVCLGLVCVLLTENEYYHEKVDDKSTHIGPG